MKSFRIGLVIGMAVIALQPLSAFSAGFIKFDGIDGEATDSGHLKWSNILSFSDRIRRTAGGDVSRSPVVFEDMAIGKQLDKSSPKLMEALAKGTLIPRVQIELTRVIGANRLTYLKYELKNVIVTNFNVAASARDAADPPLEEMSLNFEEIKVTYIEFNDRAGKIGEVVFSAKTRN